MGGSKEQKGGEEQGRSADRTRRGSRGPSCIKVSRGRSSTPQILALEQRSRREVFCSGVTKKAGREGRGGKESAWSPRTEKKVAALHRCEGDSGKKPGEKRKSSGEGY